MPLDDNGFRVQQLWNRCSLREMMRENSGVLSRRKEKTTATSPPLGGVSEIIRGRSSDLQAAYWLGFPACEGQCHSERSFLLTAAGQLRICTGFPFHPPLTRRNHETERHYISYSAARASLFFVDIVQMDVESAPRQPTGARLPRAVMGRLLADLRSNGEVVGNAEDSGDRVGTSEGQLAVHVIQHHAGQFHVAVFDHDADGRLRIKRIPAQ
jgi:hypothetical protein